MRLLDVSCRAMQRDGALSEVPENFDPGQLRRLYSEWLQELPWSPVLSRGEADASVQHPITSSRSSSSTQYVSPGVLSVRTSPYNAGIGAPRGSNSTLINEKDLDSSRTLNRSLSLPMPYADEDNNNAPAANFTEDNPKSEAMLVLEGTPDSQHVTPAYGVAGHNE
ncbi:hypothetical protein CYMTET_3315 [Cymbomonas tetramitiformis]|uniref:Uncharacterized protein n=1 Tax=Cymbomonas tetramitiformis TaxID=36881 RepID=A0AAE0LKZ8_9CHLO|nr:hypothetical protein CYMTET_3315 [Cymbomonas tetramitiformis]